MGKLHFGVLLGWSVCAAVAMFFLVNQLAGGEARALDLYGACCLVGYGMLPLALHSAAALLVPRGAASSAGAVLATVWSGHTASRLFQRRCASLEDAGGLLLYPCLLLYGAFALLSVY